MLHHKPYVRLRPNKIGTDYFVGDLHGCLSLLDRILDHLHFNPRRDRLICSGDLIDHGPHSFETLQRFAVEKRYHAVLGNHEAMAMGCLGLMPSSHDIYRVWANNGNQWRRALSQGQLEDLKKSLEGMPLSVEVPLRDGRLAGVVHAEVLNSAGWPWLKKLRHRDLQADNDDEAGYNEASILWSRRHALGALAIDQRDQLSWTALLKTGVLKRLEPTSGIDLVICGHTMLPRRLPMQVENRLMIDTGSYLPDGRVTVIDPVSRCFWSAGWANHESRIPDSVQAGELEPTVTREQAAIWLAAKEDA